VLGQELQQSRAHRAEAGDAQFQRSIHADCRLRLT
jgi:hypothetical protein